MKWVFAGWIVLFGVSSVMTVVGSFLPNRRAWVLAGIRLRYLMLGLGFLGLGLYLTVIGLTKWVDWVSTLGGLFVVGMGAAYLYGRGGINASFPVQPRTPDSRDATDRSGGEHGPTR